MLFSKRSIRQKDIVVQEALPRNVVRPVTDADREMYQAIHKKPLPLGVTFLQVYDQAGRKVQRPQVTGHIFSGTHLESVLRRARRWRRAHVDDLLVKPPKHIALGLKALELHEARANG